MRNKIPRKLIKKYLLLFDIPANENMQIENSRLIGVIDIKKLGYHNGILFDFHSSITYTYTTTLLGSTFICGWRPFVTKITEDTLEEMVFGEDAVCSLSKKFPGLYLILMGGKLKMSLPRKRTEEEEAIYKKKKIDLLLSGKFIFGGGVRKHLYESRDDNSVVALFVNRTGNFRKCVIKEWLYDIIAKENFTEPVTYDWALFLRKQKGRVHYLDFSSWLKEFSDVKPEDVGRGSRKHK
jgi:hypothetical protein